MQHFFLRTFFPRYPALSVLLFTLFAALISCGGGEKKRVLVLFAESGPAAPGLEALQKAGQASQTEVDTTSLPASITEDSLAGYSAVVFLQVPVDTLDYTAQADLERFVQGGGGVLVLGAPTDTVRNWPWYGGVGAERKGASVWKGEYDGGRFSFASHSGPDAGDELEEALAYVTKGGRPDYSDAKTERVPEANRFQVEVLDTYMYEPMEMVIFPDGRVLYIERRGEVKLYSPATRSTKSIARFDVSIEGNYEDGMLGVALDPDFEKNHWIYINYSPAGTIARQNVSRFEFRGDSIVRTTEKIVLEIPTQRETCCHSGGHLEFGPGNNLYISTGDNTSSKESDGFTPIDERAGRAPFDAQKSSGNTHDLRGKILRIHPEPDGTYTIPDGNLFPKDGSKGKPEIFVMGTRNAFRFTVDDRNGYVYWGDVGPDGGKTTERGPESYDEFNQAREAGNYGWPYFVADNKAYADFDFATNTVGPKFNPERPENNSPNNTGAKVLPPARKPMIWYPYGDSPEFPVMGKGSRSAMAGPVYYYDDFRNAKSRFPKYFDGKLFIYEWARSWVNVVSFNDRTELQKIEPFLPGEQWYKPIDMKFGPDGSLYVLQYGANYFEHNQDSRLVKITYIEGNRQPKAELTADKTRGAAPMTVQLSAEKSVDFDRNDELAYTWKTGGEGGSGKGARTTVTFSKPGIYHPEVTVTDKEGKTATARIEIRVGNEVPQVAINLAGANRTFYTPGQKLSYSVAVTDQEDGTVSRGIDPASVFVSFDELKEGKDLALLQSNSQMTGSIEFLRGKVLIAGSDCKSCHNEEALSIGPSYIAVAQRYKGEKAEEKLAAKILSGGNGAWGKNMMAAHPQHSREEAAEMVKYILSLSRKSPKGLPLSGNVSTGSGTGGTYVFRANYTDKGHPVTGAMTGSSILVLRSPKVEAEAFTLQPSVAIRHIDGTAITFVQTTTSGSFIHLPQIDLTGLDQLVLETLALQEGATLEVRTGSSGGPLIGSVPVPKGEGGTPAFKKAIVPLKGAAGMQDVYLVFRNPVKDNILFLDWVHFGREGGKRL